MIKIMIEQGSEAWFDIRCGRFTASIFKNVMSGDATASYKDLITNVAGEVITGVIEETYSNANMERGIELEPEARKEYAEIGGAVEEIGFILYEEDHNFHDWVGVSPDGLKEDNGIIEIKCPLMKAHLNYIEKNVLPNEYKWQVQGQLMVTGADYCDFVSYYPGMKLFIIRITPDIEMHNELSNKLEAAIEAVKMKIKIYDDYTFLD